MGTLGKETKASKLIRKSKYIQRKAGWGTLAKRTALFLLRFIFDHKTYYLHEYNQDGIIDVKPKMNNCNFRAISSPEELDEL